MNGREVENVETHGRDLRQLPLDIRERAMLSWNGGSRAREHLVPAGKTCSLAIDAERKIGRKPNGVAQVRMGSHQPVSFFAQRVFPDGPSLLRQIFQRFRRLMKLARVAATSACSALVHENGATPKRELDITEIKVRA